MSVIKAPYNFVPLNREVVKPYWHKYISHDIPFEDSQSGEIEVTLEAKSPIFVKNGVGKKEGETYLKDGVQTKAYDFNQFNNKYFIPGSSIKGMVRSVLEVMSFGRMENKVNDHKYALRDLSSAMKNTYLKNFKPDIILCGWLKQNEDNTYTLKDCGIPGRISHRHLDEELGTNFGSYYGEGGRFNQRNDFEKSAQKKYKLFEKRQRYHNFLLAPKQDTTGRKKFEINSDGDRSGTLVFTGQPGVRKQMRKGRWTGHHLEFIFFDDNTELLTVPENVISDFFFAYYEQDKTKWSEDWKIWRVDLASRKKAIPVFFQKDNKGNIKHLGLSYLYKLPFTHSVKESIENYQEKSNYDLSEAMFGYINDQETLKGRVHFGHAFAEKAELDKTKREVLAGPKASYFPNYIRQEVRNGKVNRYDTFMDKGAVIAGWKRYPIHSTTPKSNKPKSDVSDKIFTKFIPLKEGAVFKFKVRYHNLKKIELGALLSALTFHDTENTFHSLGMAKSLGYGKVKLTIGGVKNTKEYLSTYESYMNVALGNDLPEWIASDQLTELITMVSEQDNSGKSALEYMELKDFVTAKNKDKPQKNSGLEALDRYSKLVNNTNTAQPLCTEADIQAMKVAIQKEEKALQQLRPVKEIIATNMSQKEKELKLLFEEKKRQLLAALLAKKEELADREQQQRDAARQAASRDKKANEQAKAKEQGIDLSSIDIKNKKAFETLKKVVEDFSRKYHSKNDKQLRAEFPNGFLPESTHEAVKTKFNEIFDELGKTKRGAKDRNKWLKKNSPQLKKVTEWVGKEKAEKWFSELTL